MRNLRSHAARLAMTHRISIGSNEEDELTVAPERHLIKKYANRKLYDTQRSRYITLEGIADLVRDGHEIEVVDRDTGQDLTQVVLSQLVLSAEKRGPARLVDVGADAIHDRGQALMDYVRKTLNVPGDIVNQVERRRSDLEGMVDEAIERALRRLRIPSRHDIEAMNARIDKLSAEMGKSDSGAGSKSRSRKHRN
ncbi:MAG TPA: polyhydroxyalkanoate synthesis regulator DNA-binding domain-containing protein [Candidatus Dormibacteraeota bacterium]|nr:polyhydroxyalkanoate synthesis regulator DNA-binding domain-containing protein [Candidatus Dormibacteraeota bacterium]